jgi:dihydroneopterin aldolase
MGTILVTGIKCYAYHGCLEEEELIGGNYIVDVEIETDFEAAATDDELLKTIDYVKVYEIVNTQMGIRSKLIEHVAKRIHDSLKEELSKIQSVTVKVTKLNPPIPGDVQQVSVIYKTTD